MDVCFRAHARLINFVNHLFPAVFTRESRYDTPYEAMSAQRVRGDASPAVELHVITQGKDADNKLNTDALREIEADFIARRIREIKESGALIVCDKDGQPRAADWGDFALLFQASTSFEIYEQALADAEIPYVTIAGRGFYDRQEITDITNLLAFLVSHNDSLRLAAVLRSPMFALADETLLRLRMGNDRGTLWKSLVDDGIEHAKSEREAIEFARATLQKLQAVVGRVSAADVMIAALRETGYLATLMALPHGERRVANIEKFIEQARARPQYTLAQLVARADELKFREAREGEATIEEAGAVRLMTVHKSKGLEFPVVWVADANYTARGGRDLITVHPDYGLAIRLSADHLDTDDERLVAASFAMLQRVEAQMDAAEKKRLLYVAATRARDHLLISAAPGRGRLAGDTWLGRILRALGVDENEQPDTLDYPGGQIAIGWHDADQLLANEPRAAGDSSHDQQPVNQPAALDMKETALDRFPLIRPLAPR
jgi:ATP-dependent helicase/nuclease subunit A